MLFRLALEVKMSTRQSRVPESLDSTRMLHEITKVIDRMHINLAAIAAQNSA
jgi:hypothetical protein